MYCAKIVKNIFILMNFVKIITVGLNFMVSLALVMILRIAFSLETTNNSMNKNMNTLLLSTLLTARDYLIFCTLTLLIVSIILVEMS